MIAISLDFGEGNEWLSIDTGLCHEVLYFDGIKIQVGTHSKRLEILSRRNTRKSVKVPLPACISHDPHSLILLISYHFSLEPRRGRRRRHQADHRRRGRGREEDRQDPGQDPGGHDQAAGRGQGCGAQGRGRCGGGHR